MNKLKNYLLLVVVALGALLLSFSPAQAQSLGLNFVIKRVSVAAQAGPGGGPHIIAILIGFRDGSTAIIVRSFDSATGLQLGSALTIPNPDPQARMTDLLVSSQRERNSLLILNSARRVRIFPLAFQRDGTPVLAGQAATTGALGPDSAGEGTVLTMLPAITDGTSNTITDGTSNTIVIGTSKGEVWFLPYIEQDNLFGAPVSVGLGDGSVRALRPIARADFTGGVYVGAVSNGHLFLIQSYHPGGANASGQTLQPRIVADLRDPRRIPLIDFSAPCCVPASQRPLPVVTANGTTEIATLEIPTTLAPSGTLTLRSIIQAVVPTDQVVFNSLTWLPADGSGVLYNRGFTLEEGLVGRIWTIAGASMAFDPGALNLRGRGNFVTATIEAENNRAALIDTSSLTLSVDGAHGSLPIFQPALADLADADGDNNLDLRVKFDRAGLTALLAQTNDPTAIVRASWLFYDGTAGSASAVIRIMR